MLNPWWQEVQPLEDPAVSTLRLEDGMAHALQLINPGQSGQEQGEWLLSHEVRGGGWTG